MKDIVVIYHGNCDDGFGGAWAAWKQFGDEADYLPARHQAPLSQGLENKDIYLIDIAFPKEIISGLVKNNKKVIVIDHHEMVRPWLEEVKEKLFDPTHSGAVLAWQYFHSGQPIPKLLLHIEDSDLWSFKIDFTEEILAALELKSFDFKIWDQFAADLENEALKNKYIEQGKTLIQYEEKNIKDALEFYAQSVVFEGYQVLAVNFPRFFASKLGHELALKKSPFGIVWSQGIDRIAVSLRGDGTIDLTKVVSKYGGGGHPNASGFKIDLDQPLPWRIIKN
jgi:oligoribonuclease NrnB/cAMP/cGMP phosphodiesterase (DHH superfamily)